MRDILNKLTLLEASLAAGPAEFLELKTLLAAKIKKLPAGDNTARALAEIEDLLSNVNAGGKIGIINGELQKINDPTVTAAHKEISRYLLSIEMTPADRAELFQLWREDKLVKQEILLGQGKNDFGDVITSYKTNPAIKEFVDDMMRISALGQGKGEFGLSVLSKSITKQVGKGDLDISGRAIEVKTTDGGAGRFTDQEVGAGPGFEQAARDVNQLLKSNGFDVVKSGVSIQGAIAFYLTMQEENRPVAEEFIKQIQNLITIIFGGTNSGGFSAASAGEGIAAAMKSGNVNEALQQYAQASFNYYMSKKKDEGVLYIGIKPSSIMSVYFKEADELLASGLRLHASTVYLTSIADKRLPYPQIEIIDTTGGANAAAAADKSMAKDAAAREKAIPKSLTGGSVTGDDVQSKAGKLAKSNFKGGDQKPTVGRAAR
jgi:hypothetical protein